MNTHPLPRLHPTRTLLLLALLALIATLAIPASTHAQTDAAFAGTLAYVGQDGNVYLSTGFDTEPISLTDDAQSGVRRYAWPTWATDGRLAFFSQEIARREDQTSVLLKVYVRHTDDEQAMTAYESSTETFTYAYWAPADCPEGAGCRDLAVLITSPGGLSVLRIRDDNSTFRADNIGSGGPFYYSYAPDASRMLWQRYGQQIEIYDTDADTILQQLPDQAGIFQAPMWSPVDDRLLFSVLTEESGHELVIADGEDRLSIATQQRGSLWFSWSPDGQTIAYKLDLGPIHVVDASSGLEIAHSPQEGVIAFFWSPDSTRLAFLTLPGRDDSLQARHTGGQLAAPALQSAPPVLTWNILDATTGAGWQAYRGFIPTRDQFYLLAYFDQFAQSHRVWSADSRYLVYSALTDDGQSMINLLDTTDPAAAQPLVEGRIAVWSYQ